MPKTMADFVRDALQRVGEVDVQTLQKKLHKREALVLLDVRENDEFQRGHLPGALLIPRGILEGQAPRLLRDPAVEIVAYCGSGSRSALAADVLREMGYSRVRSLAGGFRSWVQFGGPIER